MSVKIRRAGLSDLDKVVKLWRELVDLHALLDSTLALAPDAAEHWRSSAAQWLQDENCRILIAEEGEEAIGFINALVRELPPVFAEKCHGMIADAIVTAQSRRRGVGAQLYRGIVEWFRERGVTVIELSVASTNPIGQRFWRKMGFCDHMLRMRGELK